MKPMASILHCNQMVRAAYAVNPDAVRLEKQVSEVPGT
jgi:hypothetical protein